MLLHREAIKYNTHTLRIKYDDIDLFSYLYGFLTFKACDADR